MPEAAGGSTRGARATGGAGLYLSAAFALRALSSFALLVAVTRSGSADLVRDFILCVAVVTPLQPLVEMTLRPLYVLAPRPPSLRTVLVVRTWAVALLVVGSLAVAVLASIEPAVMLPLALAKAIDLLADVWHAAVQRADRTAVMAALIGGNALLTTCLAAATVAVGGDPTAPLWTSVASSVVFLGLAVLVGARLATARGGTGAPVRGLLRQGLLTGAGVSLMGFATATPQYLLAATGRDQDLATFAYVFYVVVALDLLTNGLTQNRLVELREALDRSGRHGLARAVVRQGARLSVVNTALAAVVMLAYLPLARRATQLPLAVSWVDLALLGLLVACMPMAFVAANALLAAGRGSWNLLVSVVGAAAVAGGAAVLVPAYGLVGALAASSTGPVLRGLLGLALLRRWVRGAASSGSTTPAAGHSGSTTEATAVRHRER